MMPGDIILTTSIEVRSEVTKPGMRTRFKSNPKTAMVFIACGSVCENENEYDLALRVLGQMGWRTIPAADGLDEGIAAAMGDAK